MAAILLCVDVQCGFVVDGVVEARMHELVRRAESGRYEQIWASRFLNPGPGGPFHRWMQWYRFRPGDEEAELWAPLARLDVRVFDKLSYGPPPSLLEAARAFEPGEIHMGGLDTEACVLATAVGLFDAGAPPRVLTAACASGKGPSAHEAGLAAIAGMLGPRSLINGA
ncbi:MAG: cysteine hydrolase family protein [Longimicrobiales bacterium]